MTSPLILNFTQDSRGDVAQVGGKNASLGELFGRVTVSAARKEGRVFGVSIHGDTPNLHCDCLSNWTLC